MPSAPISSLQCVGLPLTASRQIPPHLPAAHPFLPRSMAGAHLRGEHGAHSPSGRQHNPYAGRPLYPAAVSRQFLPGRLLAHHGNLGSGAGLCQRHGCIGSDRLDHRQPTVRSTPHACGRAPARVPHSVWAPLQYNKLQQASTRCRSIKQNPAVSTRLRGMKRNAAVATLLRLELLHCSSTVQCGAFRFMLRCMLRCRSMKRNAAVATRVQRSAAASCGPLGHPTHLISSHPHTRPLTPTGTNTPVCDSHLRTQAHTHRRPSVRAGRPHAH